MKNIFTFLILVLPLFLLGQEYAMFSTMYLTPLPGHEDQLGEELSEHAKSYHNEGAHTYSVFYVNDGPNGGDFFVVKGPLTYSDLDNGPTGASHRRDWWQVTEHCAKVHTMEKWTLDADLSIGLEGTDNSTHPIHRVQLMEVDDMDLFNNAWSQLNKVRVERGNVKPRHVYKNYLSGRNGRNVAIVYPYKNWAELDADSDRAPFQETAIKIMGEVGLERWSENINKAIISSEREFHTYLPGMSGGVQNE